MIKQIENYFQTDTKLFLRFKINVENSNLMNSKYLLRGISIHKIYFDKIKNCVYAY